jgi:DNA-binding PadR family transcriptional regulator
MTTTPPAAVSVLDLFLLLLIEQKIDNLYDLKAQCGISVGAAHPALSRLVGNGLIRATERGDRRKQRYVPTPRGRRFLRAHWRQAVLSAPSTTTRDLESILRLAEIARHFRKSDLAGALLQRAAAERRERLAEAATIPARSSGARGYRAMANVCEAARLEAEMEAFHRLRNRILAGKL